MNVLSMVEKCVPQQQCQTFTTERAKLKEIRENSGRNNEEYRQLRTKLRGKVCDAKEQTVCCEKCSSDGGNNLNHMKKSLYTCHT